MPLVLDMQKISPSVWSLFQDSCGRVLDEYSVRKWTFYEGVSPDARSEVWKFLLGYYPFLSTREEREQIDKDKRAQYEELLSSWQSGESEHSTSLAEYKRVITKDCVRTDRCHASFSGDGQEATENINALDRILTTFVVFDPELGYVQGMNEYLSPLFLTLDNEHEAFWCLTEVIQRMSGVFSDLTLSQPLASLARLCYYADTQLHNHISRIHGDDDWMFCYRGVLLNFKREFAMDDVYSLWEMIWCNHLTKHFQLFVAVAILVHYKQQLLPCTSVEAFMQFAMSLSCNVPMTPVLSIARALVEQLKGDEYCPHELRYLVSDEGCAPPPLVGFVRARQRFSTLHSNKITRNDIWKTLFGDSTVQPITSPFMLSPTHQSATQTYQQPSPAIAQQYTSVDKNGEGTKGIGHSPTVGPPPRLGFVPRTVFGSNSPSGTNSQRSLHGTSPNYQNGDYSTQQQQQQTIAQSQALYTPQLSAQNQQVLSNTQPIPYLPQSPPITFNSPHRSTSIQSSSQHPLTDTTLSGVSSNGGSTGNSVFYTGNTKRTSSPHSKVRRTSSSGDAIHYDHRNEKLSGGVFNGEEIGQDVTAGAEFDHLRSEAALHF